MDRRTFLQALGVAFVAIRLDDKEVALLRAFLAKPRETQQKIAQAVRDELAKIGGPWLSCCQELATKGKGLVLQKPPAGWQHRQPRNEQSSPFADLPFALRYEYLWGYRQVHGTEKREPITFGQGKDVQRIPLDSPGEDVVGALRGFPMDLDLALAACMKELDVDSHADRFAIFLEEWRNGQESFYRALDRSAGTNEAVFYFDAMLSEFNKRFEPQDQRKSLKELHDALHHAFLAYRQHRAMREAAACITLFPPQLRLPKHLARYEDKQGAYSLRDDLMILTHLEANDPLPTLLLLNKTAAPLPDPLWATKGKHDPLAPLQKAFAERTSAKIESTDSAPSSTDQMLESANAERTRTSEAIRARASAVLSAS